MKITSGYHHGDPGCFVQADDSYQDGEVRALRAQNAILEQRLAGLAALLADLGADAGMRRLSDAGVLAHVEAQRDQAINARSNAEAELRTIGKRATEAALAIRPAGSDPWDAATGPLDAVASLDVYARNLKTRAQKAEAEASDLRDRLKHAEHERDNWKHSWEENTRAQLQRQKRKARR